jgi:hypothetical protein
MRFQGDSGDTWKASRFVMGARSRIITYGSTRTGSPRELQQVLLYTHSILGHARTYTLEVLVLNRFFVTPIRQIRIKAKKCTLKLHSAYNAQIQSIMIPSQQPEITRQLAKENHQNVKTISFDK